VAPQPPATTVGSSSAGDYLAKVRDDFVEDAKIEAAPAKMSRRPLGILRESLDAAQQVLFKRSSSRGGEDTPEDETRDLLCQVRDLLAELGSDTRFTGAGGPDHWQRVTTPDVEFHVRQPDNTMARLRLARMAQALSRLLEREE
jgi:hypothetical protein